MVSLLVTQVALAQKTITGVVSDDQGMPLPGATVLEQGTSNGVSTDFDGNYSIEVAEGSVLEYSFVGSSGLNLILPKIGLPFFIIFQIFSSLFPRFSRLPPAKV